MACNLYGSSLLADDQDLSFGAVLSENNNDTSHYDRYDSTAGWTASSFLGLLEEEDDGQGKDDDGLHRQTHEKHLLAATTKTSSILDGKPITSAGPVAVTTTNTVGGPLDVLKRRRKRDQRPTSTTWFVVSIAAALTIGWILFCYSLYRPLPEGFTERTKMQIVDAAMRVVYYYPSRWTGSPTLTLQWTRWVLSTLSWLTAGNRSLHNDQDYRISDVRIAGVLTRVYQPRTAEVQKTDAAVIFIHGGGFVVGEIEMYEPLTREMARRIGAAAFLSVEYRLAPEYPYPAGVLDCEAVVIEFLQRTHRDYGVDPRKVVVMGDSAGGNLAAVVAQRLRHRQDLPAIKLQVLIYPLLQFHDLRTPSYQMYYDTYAGTTFLDPDSIAYYYMMYAGLDLEGKPHYAASALRNAHVPANVRSGQRHFVDFIGHHRLPLHFVNGSRVEVVDGQGLQHEAEGEVYAALAPYLFDPSFAPLMADDLSGLPTALVITCQYDILRDDGALYTHRLEEHGVNTTWLHYENGFHAMLNFFFELQLARDTLDDIARWILTNVDQA